MAPTNQNQNPANLVAIIIAARRVGNRELEREMRNQLQERHNVRVVFGREREGVTHDRS
jgi:tRNA C32,U32 (ribose-2'-O)-methylase TrmJ